MQQQKHIKTCSIPILRKARLLKSFCSVNKGDTSIWDQHQSYEFAYISTNRFWTVRTRTVYASHIVEAAKYMGKVRLMHLAIDRLRQRKGGISRRNPEYGGKIAQITASR